jgi:CIC family chloride channel protein
LFLLFKITILANSEFKMKALSFFKQSINWTKRRLSKKQFLFFSSVLVGLSAGLAAVILKLFVHFILWGISDNALINSQYFYVILPILGILFTVLIVKIFLNNKLEKGIAKLHVKIKKRSSFIPSEQMYAQVITSSVTVGFGGSAGLEAPIVITGAAFGSNYAKTHKLNQNDRTLLLACGVSAGIAAAFNAPIAGVLFALEVLLLDIGITAFIPLIIAAASGALVSKIILHDNILLSSKSTVDFDYKNVFFYALLGVLAGLISVYHARVFSAIESKLSHYKMNPFSKVILGGSCLAFLILLFPSLYGEGYESIKWLSSGQEKKILNHSLLESFVTNEYLLLAFIGLVIFFKSIATGLTLGSGGNGGNFAPSLFVGAFLGFFMSRIVNLSGYFKLPESNFTLVGMAGILSGLYHAPLTSIFLIAEITGGHTLMIPLMIVSSISYAISRYFEPQSLDIKKLGLFTDSFAKDKDKTILSSIQLERLIDQDFTAIHPEMKLGELVEIIKISNKNVFPVITSKNELLGLVLVDNIKDIMFSRELYQKVQVVEIYSKINQLVQLNDSADEILEKFEKEDLWVLPVLNNRLFIGFISKSKILSNYREKLINTIIE